MVDGRKLTAHRAIQIRRDEVLRLWAWGIPAGQILEIVKQKQPGNKITISMIYQDIEYLKKLGDDYIELKFIPQFGQTFMKVITNVEEYRKDARLLFAAGVKKVTTTTYPDGKVRIEEAHESKNLAALRLALDCDVVLVNAADTAAVLQQVGKLKSRVDLLKRERIDDVQT